MRPTVPFAKNRQRHGRNCGAEGVTDRAYCKKWAKARSKLRSRGCDRPCLLQKMVKGTVEIAEERARPTVPFAKKRQRHGRNCGGGGVRDRAFCKKTSKARSKLWSGVRSRPCLLQKIIKGTVKIARQGAWPTVPFTKNGQRHGRNCEAGSAPDRAFYKKWSKARSKLRSRGCGRPCLSQKNAKGTVETAEQGVRPTVPFAKNGQRHGRNCEAGGVTDRAFRKKMAKARSKLRRSVRVRPCLSQKNDKSTVNRLRRRFINKERRSHCTHHAKGSPAQNILFYTFLP